jgi:hypothetical protein
MSDVTTARLALLYPQFWFDKSTPPPPTEPLTPRQQLNVEVLVGELDRRDRELQRQSEKPAPAPPAEHASGQGQKAVTFSGTMVSLASLRTAGEPMRVGGSAGPYL